VRNRSHQPLKKFGNRYYYDKLGEIADPKRAALLIINMQNDHCNPGGYYEKMGFDVSMHREIIPRVSHLAQSARKAGVLIIHLQHTIIPGFIEDSPPLLGIYVSLGADIERPLSFHDIEGTWGHQIIDQLKPQEGDFIIKYNRLDPFIGSNLEQQLRSHLIESLILCGNETQEVVQTGKSRDFYRVMVKDCVASTKQEYHEHTLRLMGDKVPDFPLVDSSEITAIWAQKR